VAESFTVMQLLPALESGGVERSTVEIAHALHAAGQRALVVSAGGRLQPQLETIGAEHITMPIGRKSVATLRHVFTLRRLIASMRPDIVHARSRLPAWLGWWAVRGLPGNRRPHFVTTVHGLNSVGRYSAIMTRGERVIAVSDSVRRYLLENYPIEDARIVVIPRGIEPSQWPRGYRPDPQWLARWQRELPMLAGRRVLLLPARGTRLKGHGDAICLLAGLVAGGEDAALWLLGADEVGRVPYLAELRELARQQGVADRLAISPPRADVRDAMAVSDIVLQLSGKPESFGRTVVEAASLGRPILGWAHGGVGELLAELYPAGAVALGDHEGLLASARCLLASAPLPIPPDERYALARMQQQTLDVYADVLRERRP
jgi:glycosyltransferase involved in cell wall biosynthesis